MRLEDIGNASNRDVAFALEEKLGQLRQNVLCSPKGMLRRPYVIPGGYDQAWDWDSYFIGVALADWPESWPYLRGTVENFFDNMREDGRMPRWLHPEKSFWDSNYVDIGFERDLAKPFFAQLALLYSEATGDFGWFKPYLERERKFLSVWRDERMSSSGLYVWANGLESGGDNHPNVFGWPSFSVEGVDLAVFLIREHLAAAILSFECGDYSEFQNFWSTARFLEHQMTEHLFDRAAGKFRNRYRPTGQLIRVETQTQFYPLWLGSWLTVSEKECRTVIERDLLNDKTFYGPHGVRSTSKCDPSFNNTAGTAPSNWQGPIWLVGNYLHLNSLIGYGFQEQAIELATRIQRMLLRDLLQRGEMAECYHSETGECLAIHGFLSWNLLARHFLKDAEDSILRGRLPLERLVR